MVALILPAAGYILKIAGKTFLTFITKIIADEKALFCSRHHCLPVLRGSR